MTPESVLDALQLPAQSRIAHRVPKTLLVENGAPTTADKRQIENGIEELRWVATLKPTTVGVASYADDTREAVELAVLTLRLRAKAKLARLVELVHRAIPYHLLLLTQPDGGALHLSLADKRWAQNEKGKVVIDGDLVQCDALLAASAAAVTGAFVPAQDERHARDRAEALSTCAALESKITSLRAAASKEKQLARQVEINTQLKKLRAELDDARARL